MNEQQQWAGLSPWLVQDVPAEKKRPSGGHWGGRGVPTCQLTSVTSQWGHGVSTSRNTGFVSITAAAAPNLDMARKLVMEAATDEHREVEAAVGGTCQGLGLLN